MRAQYPFFRDADERTRAVIGGEAADSDLNGTYQKPYAILSDKRLYCKNEQGNFIADGKSARFQGREKARRPWMILVSTLLLFSILLTFFANGSALGLLTFQTQRAAGEAAKFAALRQEVYSIQQQLAISGEDADSLARYAEKSEQLTRLQNSMSDYAQQIVHEQFYEPGTGDSAAMREPNSQDDKSYYYAYYAWRIEEWSFSEQLQRAAFFATLCAWVALIGCVALLVLFRLNLGKLAGLAGIAAGAVCVLCSVLGDPWRVGAGVYFNLPSVFTKWFPAVMGLAVVVLCILAILQRLKREAVPTFQLVTSAGTFIFREKDYPKEEREAFAAAVSQGEGEA